MTYKKSVSISRPSINILNLVSRLMFKDFSCLANYRYDFDTFSRWYYRECQIISLIWHRPDLTIFMHFRVLALSKKGCGLGQNFLFHHLFRLTLTDWSDVCLFAIFAERFAQFSKKAIIFGLVWNLKDINLSKKLPSSL